MHRSGNPFRLLFIGGVIAALSGAVAAQSLHDRLDEQRYLQGLSELGLTEVLEHYMQEYPAEDPIRAAQLGMAAERMAMRQPGTTAAQRIERLERIFSARAQLMERYPRDPQRASWLMDQCTDLLFELFMIEGAGLTTLYGLPTPAQRERAIRVAQQVHEIAQQTERIVDQLILDLEASPDYGSNPAAQTMRRNLAERERDRRIPFYRGIGAYLHATLIVEDAPQRTALYEMAYTLLEPLQTRLDGALASQARLYAGLALVPLQQTDAAEALFRQVINDPAASATDLFIARMGSVLNRRQSSGPDAALIVLNALEEQYQAASDVFFRILLADQRFELTRQLAQQSATVAQRERRMEEAFNAYTQLLQRNAVAGVDPTTLQAIVLSKLSQVAEPGVPLDRLPAIVTVAHAEALARDEDTLDDAIDLFAQAMHRRADMQPNVQALALFAYGRALARAQRPLEAAAILNELAREHSTSRHAEQAITLAASLTADAYQRHRRSAEARQALQATLQLMFERYANLPRIDRWRYLAGRVALDEQQWNAAIESFQQVDVASDQYLDAQFMQARAAHGRAEAAGDDQHRNDLARASLAMIEQVRPALVAGRQPIREAARRAAVTYYLHYLDVFEAEAHMMLGDAQRAIEALEPLRAADEGEREIDPAIVADGLRLRISAYQSLNQPERAMSEVRQLLDAAPDDVDEVVVPLLAGMERQVHQLLEQGLTTQAEAQARGELLELATLLDNWIGERGMAMSEQRELYHAIARVYELAGRYLDALTIFEQLLSYESNSAALLRGQAECLYHIGGDGLSEAMRLFRRLTAAGPDVGHDIYWLSQLRSVQILDQVNRNTDQIVPHIQRLEQADPNLGGLRYRQQFNTLLAKYR